MPVAEVEWIEAFENYVRLHTGQTTHLLHVPMNKIGAVLDSGRFLRIQFAGLGGIAHICFTGRICVEALS